MKHEPLTPKLNLRHSWFGGKQIICSVSKCPLSYLQWPELLIHEQLWRVWLKSVMCLEQCLDTQKNTKRKQWPQVEVYRQVARTVLLANPPSHWLAPTPIIFILRFMTCKKSPSPVQEMSPGAGGWVEEGQVRQRGKRCWGGTWGQRLCIQVQPR